MSYEQPFGYRFKLQTHHKAQSGTSMKKREWLEPHKECYKTGVVLQQPNYDQYSQPHTSTA